jgi:hypothetical protein
MLNIDFLDKKNKVVLGQQIAQDVVQLIQHVKEKMPKQSLCPLWLYHLQKYDNDVIEHRSHRFDIVQLNGMLEHKT